MLTGMNFGPHITVMFGEYGKKRRLGHFFMAIDISRFQDPKIFKKRLKQMVTELRDEPVAEGFDKVKVANDPEKQAYRIRSKKGIPLTDADVKNFIEIADMLKIDKAFLR
jgi:ureidoglycolate dehydrogenase (NAD+)